MPERYLETHFNRAGEAADFEAESRLSREDKLKLLFTYRSAMISLVKRMLRDDKKNQAEDIVSDAYVKAVKSIDDFKHTSSLKTWLTRISINCCFNHLRHARRYSGREVSLKIRVNDAGEEIIYDVPDPALNQEERLARYSFIESALEVLSPEEREALILTTYEGLSVKEAAEASNITEGAQKSRKNAATTKLKKQGKVL